MIRCSLPVSPRALPDLAADRPMSNLEWWYAYAYLAGESGRRYAIVASFFRVGELPVAKGHYLIHSLIRLDEGGYEPRSCLDRTLVRQMAAFYLPIYFLMKPGDRQTWNDYFSLAKGEAPYPHCLMESASVRSSPVRLTYGSSSLTFAAEGEPPGFGLVVSDGRTSAELRFEPAKPPAVIDEEGSLNGLKYYSVTRNRVVGRLRFASGESERVSGEGWFDRQWGQNYDLLKGRGWDWFGLQLEDGRELLVSRLRPREDDPPESAIAKLVDPDGVVATTEEATLTPSGSWRSLYTGLRYPTRWRLSLPAFGLELSVTPYMPHQEIPIPGPIRAIWEGACSVEGERIGPAGDRYAIRGRGFAELVGYRPQA